MEDSLSFINESEDETALCNRILDVWNETGEALSPITLEKTPLLSLSDSLTPLKNLVPHIENYSFCSLCWAKKASIHHGLTIDETAAINLYTREWSEKGDSLYYRMNEALRKVDRTIIKPYFKYLKLLLTALSKLPSYSCSSFSLWRGVNDRNGDIAKKYVRENTLFWWGFSSCTTNIEVLKGFVGDSAKQGDNSGQGEESDQTGNRIIFNIHYITHVVDVKEFSLFQKECEVLLLPARCLKVINHSEISKGTFIIEMQEIQSPSMLQGIQMPIQTFSLSHSHPNVQSSSKIQNENLVQKKLQDAEKKYEENDFYDAFEIFFYLQDKDMSGHAFFRMAQCYDFGDGVEKDEKKALFYFSKAITLLRQCESALCLTDLGCMYDCGKGGLQKDEKEAARLYKLAADQDYPRAQNILGIMYQNGQGGLEKDEKEAVKLYQLASKLGYAQAQYNLGIMYNNGQGGLEKDEKEAVKLYRLASKQGHSRAQNSLGLMYMNGQGGLEKNEKEAALHFQLAAKQGYAQARYNLGIMYSNGRGGLQKDEKEAAVNYQLAAQQGYAQAQINLGIMYKNGQGGLKDEKEAARLFQLAANQGYAQAQYNLGMMYENGQGLQKDEKEAVRFYQLAANQGYAQARYNLGMMYENGQGGLQKDEKEAVRLFQLAADQNNSSSLVHLGKMYEKGRGGIIKDKKEARKLYERAASLGNKYAQDKLNRYF